MNESIKDYLPTPSSALIAMCDGLEAQHTVIDMATFGHQHDGVCYGCAATNTILHAIPYTEPEHLLLIDPDFDDGEGFVDDVVEEQGYPLDPDEISDFEVAVDESRCGHLYRLFRFYGTPLEESTGMPRGFAPCGRDEDGFPIGRWTAMDTDNYLEIIPEVRAFAAKLQARGL